MTGSFYVGTNVLSREVGYFKETGRKVASDTCSNFVNNSFCIQPIIKLLLAHRFSENLYHWSKFKARLRDISSHELFIDFSD